MNLFKRDFSIGRDSVPLEEQKKKCNELKKGEKKKEKKDCINVQQKDLLHLRV